jgi:phosphatidylglycerol:prolipoprotein diacylglycerol transferase
MPGPFVHRIDPIFADIGGLHLWWYGLGYTLGFLQIFRFLKRHRASLSLSASDVYALTLALMAGILVGGRAIEVAFDEWHFYRAHPQLVLAYWLGGMATHGLLMGAAVAVWLFARRSGKSFLALADALVIPAALLMGLGRIGNFVDGQIVGSVTDVWWGVEFPYADGFRHPVVLYDAAKNLMLMIYLMWVRHTNRTPGATAARFVFWYAFPRIGIDLFRDYPTHRLALGTGQTLNIIMAAVGLVLLVRSRMRRLGMISNPAAVRLVPVAASLPSLTQRVAFVAVLLFCLTIPSNWTQDVPTHYAKRHEGLRHSWIYPQIDTSPNARHTLGTLRCRRTMGIHTREQWSRVLCQSS